MQKKTVSQSKGGLDLTQEFEIVSKFLGYTNRVEPTNLPPGYLVSGAQNVMLDVTGNVKSRLGYTLDGQQNSTLSGVLTAFDWEEHDGGTINLRHWGSNLEFRYVAANGNVTWIPLVTTVGSQAPVRFTNYWDNVQLENVLLYTRGFTDAGNSTQFYLSQWNGAYTTLASSMLVQANSIDLTGTIDVSTLSLDLGETANFTLTQSGSGIGFSGNLLCNANPTNGQSLFLTINGTIVAVTFVSSIGSSPGSILIAGTTAGTLANLIGLLTNPSTTSSTQVAFAAGDQILIKYFYYQAAGTYYITNSGQSWKTIGFYVAKVGYNGADRKITINGNTYKYEGYSGNKMFGLTSNPTGEAIGSVVVQRPVDYGTNNGLLFTGFPNNFNIDLISNLNNQIYYGSLNSNQVYISKVNDFTNVSFTTPVALVGEGGLLSLRSSPTAFVVQESTMYISAQNSTWYTITLTVSSDGSKQTFTINPLKIGANQAAQSQEVITKDKNDIVFITLEPVVSTLGRVVNQLATPMTQDLSWMIVNDINKYNLTRAYLKYFKNFIYIALPSEGKVLIYNQTDPKNPFWEAPQILPFSCFSIINGAIYAHDKNFPQSYKLFDGIVDSESNFLALNQGTLSWNGMAVAPNGNVYSCVNGGDIYMQTAGAGNFVALGQANLGWWGMCAAPNGNIYACNNGGDVYMQTGGVGSFNALSQTNRNWTVMCADANGNVYAAVQNGDIYKQTGGVGNFVAEGQTSRAWQGMTVASNGDIYASTYNGDIYKQTGGSGTFNALSQTTRLWRGMCADALGNIYAAAYNGDIYIRKLGAGNFIAMGQTSNPWFALACSLTSNIYSAARNVDIFSDNISVTAIANFSFMNMGIRELKKWFVEFYNEGLINNSTTLLPKIQYEYGSLGSTVPFTYSLPAANGMSKFRVIKTTPRVDFYEVQPSFSSIGYTNQWEIIAFGFLVTLSEQLNNAIKQ